MNPNFISIEAWVVYDFYNNFYYKRENIFAYRSHKNFNIWVYTQTSVSKYIFRFVRPVVNHIHINTNKT